jgi:PIN domain nuclease of toxin-antitoxin system
MFIADACALIVFLTDPLAAIAMPDSFSVMCNDVVAVSPITVWEITQKVAAGKLPRVWGDARSLPHLLLDQGFQPRPLTWEDAAAANDLPPYHKDPMDRLLIATARRDDMTIITSDATFAAYGVKTMW